ncbi:MAG: hypothetical protein GX605_12235 [Chloroflexi bacterium]|nr:hypothetical protein [Chloroflexota bacterium]
MREQITYRLSGGLSDAQIRTMHEKALRLAEEVGLLVPHAGVLDLLAGHPGVTIQGQRVHFAQWLLDATWRTWRCPFPPSPDWSIISGGMMLVVVDAQTGRTRQPTQQDLVDLAKLADSYGMACAPAVYPMDLPQPLWEIAMYKTLWETAEHTISGLYEMVPKTTLASAHHVHEMAQVAGKPFSLGLWLISPFRVDPDGLEIIYRFLDAQPPLWVATMPTAGLTAPIFLAGAYLQSMAEALAGFTLLKLISRGSPVYFGGKEVFRAYVSDMRQAAHVYGSPEDILATLMEIDLNRYYGLPTVAKSLNTTSKAPDQRAGVERALYTMAAALAGARVFVNAGQLWNMYSAEQIVVDYEIVQQARRVAEGFEFSDDALSYEAIRQTALSDGNFLMHESTVRHFRRLLWVPEAFDRSGVNQWETDPVSYQERVRAIARQRIARHQFRLEPTVARELQRIYTHAQHELVG